MTPRKRLIYFGVVVLLLLDKLRRVFLEKSPYDIAMFVMELLVLLLIGYEIGKEHCHGRKIRRRSKEISKFLLRGRELCDTAPVQSREANGNVEAWNKSVTDWVFETGGFLKRYSPQAEAAFIEGAITIGSYRGLHRDAQRSYSMLLFRLEKLRGVLERPEVYFS